MKTLVKLSLVTAVLIVAGPSNADDDYGRHNHKHHQVPKHSQVWKVNCNRGKTITGALKRARAGDTIRVRGTCHESVKITMDRITLRGIKGAVIDGGGGEPTAFAGVIVIDGVQGVELEGLTVRNGRGEGILAQNGAGFTARNITVEDNAGPGMQVTVNSTANLSDVTIRRGGQTVSGLGLVISDNSTAVLKGTISSTDNPSNGIAIQSRSVVEVRGATVKAINNGGSGFDIVDSTAVIFGTPESPGSSFVAKGNGRAGIFVALGSLQVFGGNFAGTGAFTIHASNNANGIQLVDAGRIVSPFASVDILVEDNTTGLNFGDGTGALILTGEGGGLTVRNNKTGLLADGADTSTLVSAPPNVASIEDNTVVDVDLRFGSRLRIVDVAVGSLVCDATVLLAGTTGFSCPTP